MYRHNPKYQDLLKTLYQTTIKDAQKIRHHHIYNDPICQRDDKYVSILLHYTMQQLKTIIPQRRRLMEEYFKKMAPKEKKDKPNKSVYMPSTVFTESSEEIFTMQRSLRGFLRIQQENRPREKSFKTRRTYDKLRDSSQVKDALSTCRLDTEEDECRYDNAKLRSKSQNKYPFHLKNTFNRIVKGDPSYDRHFRSNNLFKPLKEEKCRRDNIKELFEIQQKNIEDDDNAYAHDYFLPINPTKQNYSQIITLTAETARNRKLKPYFK